MVKIEAPGRSRFVLEIELLEWGSRMRHCVASYAAMAVQGKVQIFHGEVGGEPVTIEIAFRNGKPALRQACGIRNARPGPKPMRIIQKWFEDLFLALSRTAGGRLPHLTGRFVEG